MNDSVFVNYDNYYYAPSSHQVTDPLTQSLDTYEEMPPSIQYTINSGSCDMASLSQANVNTTTTNTVDHHRQQQSTLFNFIPHAAAREEQERLENTCVSKRVSNTNNVVTPTGSSTTVFGNIPFVQIHTTDVQPQRTSYGNVFRRHISRQEEIKSEPIKSENNEATKERSNTTPTPPRTATQNTNNLESMEELDSSNKQANNNISSNIEEKSLSLLEIYKCSNCLFISLKETERDEHMVQQHGENNTKTITERCLINCPGCSNVFYARDALQIHLQLDHLMREEDVRKLTDSLIKSNQQEQQQQQRIQCETNQDSNDDSAPKEPLRKSRIYLKNVDFLREPNRQPMEQTDNQLEQHGSSETIETKKSNAPKQKISIKSVDVLREPALLRRDYELQNSNVNNFLNFNTDLLSGNMDLLNTPIHMNTTTPSTSYDYVPHLDNVLNNTNNLNNNNECNTMPNVNSNTTTSVQANDKPRKPKIYVKSVESFNLMPLDAILHTSNNNNVFPNDSQVYDTNVVHMPYMFESSATSNNNVNYINNHNDMDTFQFIGTSSNHNNNFILDNTLFLSNNEEQLNVNGEQMENVNFINDSTTPTPPATADINAVMNKPLAPLSTTQEQRGTLHLRTVDELNLMNKTEVQHLIAPNLDNNNHGNVVLVDKVNSSSLNDINLISDALYEDDNFKFHDLDTQMVNDWPETYDDLAEDINCIIADASNENSNAEHVNYVSLENNQKMISSSSFDIDTPQVSLITIRDIEELTGVTTSQAINITNITEPQTDLIVEPIHNTTNNELRSQINIVSQETLMPLEVPNDSDSSRSNLKRELFNATPESNETTTTATTTSNTAIKVLKQNFVNDCDPKTVTVVEMPPLVPVTSSITDLSTETNSDNGQKDDSPNTDMPVPPLVPVSPLVKLTPAKPTSPVEKGRIYVANNLMEPSKLPVAVSATSGTSVRGRPFGSNRTRITKLKRTIGSSAEDLFAKCSIKGCAFRFKKNETVEYHRKCHDMTSDSPQAMLCPECNSKEYNNWNTLHTHLWRAHKIDMELYKCELCEFKTPIFSRLVNTHAKIHFDDRNYKCEQCEKAFKNSKQLKNHRRWHRVQVATVATPAAGATTATKSNTTEIHRCNDCGSTFAQYKTLREHCCKKGESSLKCSICEKLMSSKSSLKLHLLTHSDGEKRYKCQNCDYATNDHNAFRRHRMGHENRKMYNCNFCPYKSVQSVAYQKHILQKHPEKAETVIHKCSSCSFSTINRSLLIVHQAKHDTTNTSSEISKAKVAENNSKTVKISEKPLISNTTDLQKSKIKVKSNLFTNNMETEGSVYKNVDNLVQLYAVDSGSVT